MKKTLLGLLFVGATVSTGALAETVNVKHQGPVDLEPFTCTDTESSFVHRICYQPEQSYLVVLLGQTYYHYCRLPSQVFSQWLNAYSKGNFYNGSIKGNFDCRMGGIPKHSRPASENRPCVPAEIYVDGIGATGHAQIPGIARDSTFGRSREPALISGSAARSCQ